MDTASLLQKSEKLRWRQKKLKEEYSAIVPNVLEIQLP